MLHAGVTVTSTQLLFLCGIPDLAMIAELLFEAILSYHAGQDGLSMIRLISNPSKLTNTARWESTTTPQETGNKTEANATPRNPTENIAMAHQIAHALAKLPTGMKLKCCDALLKNPVWRSLGAKDWPRYKETFEVIIRARGLEVDSSQGLLLTAAKNRDAVTMNRLLDADPKCSSTALEELLNEVVDWGNTRIFKRLINELRWICEMYWFEGNLEEKFVDNAIADGKLAFVQEYLDARIAVDFDETRALKVAIVNQQKDIIEWLLESGAMVNELCEDPEFLPTPLSLALESGDIDLFRLLVRYGANLNDEEALSFASQQSMEVFRVFVRTCAKDFLVRAGAPMLYQAILDYNLPVVQLLLEHGVSCNATIRVRNTHLDSAIDNRSTCLAAAIEVDCPTMLELILDTGVNINAIVRRKTIPGTSFWKGYSALAEAMECHSSSVIEALLDAGAEVNPSRTSDLVTLVTPLEVAAEKGDYDLVQMLLNLGANVNQEPSPYGGRTPLQITAAKGLIGVASLLLEHGADVNAKGARKGGRTAPEAAEENDRIDMVRLLVNSGADIGPGSDQFSHASKLAAENGHFAVLSLLNSLFLETGGGIIPALNLSAVDGNSNNPNTLDATRIHELSVELPNALPDDLPDESLSVPPDEIPIAGLHESTSELPDKSPSASLDELLGEPEGTVSNSALDVIPSQLPDGFLDSSAIADLDGEIDLQLGVLMPMEPWDWPSSSISDFPMDLDGIIDGVSLELLLSQGILPDGPADCH